MLNSGMPLMTVLIAARLRHADRPAPTVRCARRTRRHPRHLLPEAQVAGTNAAGVVLVLIAVSSYGVAVNLAGPLQPRTAACR